jgi:hypothetical protein
MDSPSFTSMYEEDHINLEVGAGSRWNCYSSAGSFVLPGFF